MTKKPRPGKRKREESPDYASKTRQRKTNTISPQQSLVTSAYPSSSDLNKLWMQFISNAEEITEEHALAACGIGPLSQKQCCPNKYSLDPANATKPSINDDAKEIINLESDVEEVQVVVSCSRAKCKTNPYCLNYLGQDKWQDLAKAKKTILDKVNTLFSGNPHFQLRKEGMPVGLRNLGATCYANAFIQVWNQDLTFRSAVFKCVPTNSDDASSRETSPIFQLQLTFAALSQGSLGVFDPHLLVESLKLNSTEQQDAQEFSKLFLSHLASEFAKQAEPSLRNIVSGHFGGTSVYGTQCHGCRYKSERETEFLELELHLRANCSLEESLEDALKSEVLSGDNQYRCSQCSSLQDATRYIQLRKLPPVLHFSVQRFVFDLQYLERKKSKFSLSYPTSLDMAKWMGERSDSDSAAQSTAAENQYELCGVLLHKGPSAYHGHYEAQVMDVSSRQWYQFNDEVVTKIELGQSNKAATNGEEVTTQKRSSSKDCYCLVYLRRDHMEQRQEPIQAPPTDVADRVAELSKATEDACIRYDETLKMDYERLEDFRNQRIAVYENWNVQNHEDPVRIVSQQILQEFMTAGFPLTAKADSSKEERGLDKANGLPDPITEVTNGDAAMNETKPAVATTSNSGIHAPPICVHGKLDPARASEFKVITPEAFDAIAPNLLERFGTQLEQSICIQCVRAIYEEHMYFSHHSEVVQMVKSILSQNLVEEGETRCLVSKAWLQDWSLQKPKMHTAGRPDPSPNDFPYISDLLCDHGLLSTKPSQHVSVPEVVCAIFREMFSDWEPIPVDTPSCDSCISSGKASSQNSKEAEIEKNALKSLLFLGSPVINRTAAAGISYTILPSAWIYAWSRWAMKPNAFPRPLPPDNTVFLCSHDLLTFDPTRSIDLANPDVAVVSSADWACIENLYPNAGPKLEFIAGQTSSASGSYSICGECSSSLRVVFEECTVATVVLRPSSLPPTVASYDRDIEEVCRRVDFGAASNVQSGTRRSKRARDGDSLGRVFLLKFPRSASVKDIKLKIETSEKVPAFYQTLYYKDKELDNSEVQIGDLGIEVRDLLYMRPAEESVIKIDIDSGSDVEIVEGSSAKRARRVETKAFEGSLLLGGR